MLARTHDLAAITALGIVFLAHPPGYFTVSTGILAVIANQVGGITPDIDQPTAPLWRNLPIGGVIGRMIDKMLGGHRFLTHSLLGLALFGYLAHLGLTFTHSLMPAVDIGLVWWAFMIGMFSHLVMDTITKEGVPWLLPIPIKFGIPPIKALRITTGKWMEKLVVVPSLLACNAYLYHTHFGQIMDAAHKYLI
jgi:inner membrane protein